MGRFPSVGHTGFCHLAHRPARTRSVCDRHCPQRTRQGSFITGARLTIRSSGLPMSVCAKIVTSAAAAAAQALGAQEMMQQLGMLVGAVLLSADASNGRDWSVAVGKINGENSIVRCRSSFPQSVVRPQFATLATITWQYNSPNGMPSGDTKSEMDALEDGIVSAVESADQAYLAIAVTGGRVREWEFYARGQEQFTRLTTKAFSRAPAEAVSTVFRSDPTWSSYGHFAACTK